MMLVKCWLFLARCCRNLLDQDTSLRFFKVSILSKVLLRDSEISESFFSEAMQVSQVLSVVSSQLSSSQNV